MLSLRRLALAGALLTSAAGAAAAQEPAHGIAMHGDLKYPADFSHLEYANPDAPEGGELHQALIGSYDSLNPFIASSRPPLALDVTSLHFPALLARAWDEPFSLYAYVAESVRMAEDRSWVEFQLDPRAVFHDGTPITVDDVIFTMETLREKGLPNFRTNYEKIAGVERVGDRGVRFTFAPDAGREMPMLMGLMPVISKAWYSEHPIDRPSLDVPLGGGPYRIATVDPGRSLVYERVADWWAQDLPVFRGQNNFDRIRFDFYRDASVAFEAFKAGEYNFRREEVAEAWVTAYEFPAAQDGRVTMLTLPQFRPAGMNGLAMNTRRPLFADDRVRQALILAFDFEAINKTLLHGQYERTDSFFANSSLASSGAPEGRELELLEPFRDQLPAELFTTPYEPPVGDGTGRNRDNLRAAQRLLGEAGWQVKDGVLTDGSGQPFRFEILLRSAADEKVVLAYADQLRRLGIEATVRVVDSAQYTARAETYDFDMTLYRWVSSLSPGAEQSFYWSSASADTPGTRNYPGVESPAVDALAQGIAAAATREDLEAAAHAFDRALLWGHYVVPLYYLDRDLIAYWGNLGRVTGFDPIYGTEVKAWWANP